MKCLLSLALCFSLCFSLAPSSYAVTSKEQIYLDIDPMIDAQDYDGIANYFIMLKNEAYTVDGATIPYVKGNTLYLPSKVTEINDEAFAYDANIDFVVIPDSVTYIAENAFYNIDDLTIIASELSYAYSWAVSHGYAVRTLPEYEDKFIIILTNENFFDYFELAVLPYYNSFGEIRDNSCRLGVRSKLYDIGYVLTDIDATIEITITRPNNQATTNEYSLRSLLSFTGFGGVPMDSDFHVNRLVSNGITYVNANLITYELNDKTGYDRYSGCVKYQEGATTHIYSRTVVDGYLY